MAIGRNEMPDHVRAAWNAYVEAHHAAQWDYDEAVRPWRRHWDATAVTVGRAASAARYEAERAARAEFRIGAQH